MKFIKRTEANEFYADILSDAEKTGNVHEVMNHLGRVDLFFLLTKLLHRRDVNRDWLFDRCRDVQLNPDGMLDLWAREHYKSTIITFAKSIQDILDSHHWKQSADGTWEIDSLLGWKQEVTIGIFSHTRPIAKAFLGQIKTEFETNELLKQIYPDVLWENPRREAPRWGDDKGIVVKRRGNPKESTIEAWGLVDGQPTSKHYLILNYDDVVTRESVTNSDQMEKTTDALALSYNLGAHGGVRRFIGTRYHFNDSYRAVLERGTAEPRIFPATDDGTEDGNPVFLTKEALREKRADSGPYVFACQQLQDPRADKAQGFRFEWLKYYSKVDPANFNTYLLVDPAGEKKRENDYTSMVVIGLGSDKNYYLLDAVRDRLNLAERTRKLFELHRKWHPKATGYEKYGKDSDIEHIEEKMDDLNYHFEITPLGGQTPKNDRIRKLVPIFESARFWMPHRLLYMDYEGNMKDYVYQFINDEYTPFPVGVHDDMFDNIARIVHPEFGAEFPSEKLRQDYKDEHLYARDKDQREEYKPY